MSARHRQLMLGGEGIGSVASSTVGTLIMAASQPWMVEALCAQVDTDIFFPEKGGSTRDAKKICSRCEVVAHCLEWALEHDERFGVWGGMSERERRRLQRTAAA